MTITLLCAGALAVPGGADDPKRRRELLTRFAPDPAGAATRWLERQAAAASLRISDETAPPAEMPDEQWQEIARSRLRHQSKVSERQLELRLGRRVNEIAVEEHGHADSDRDTVHGGDQGFRELGDTA